MFGVSVALASISFVVKENLNVASGGCAVITDL